MKAQSYIEYLMTYGWAILIILIVGGVLAYYGIFSPESFLGPTAQGFQNVQVLNPWQINTNGDMILNLRNLQGGPIKVLNVSYIIYGEENFAQEIRPNNYIHTGAQQTYFIKMSEDRVSDFALGRTYSATVVIEFEIPNNNAVFKSAGTLTGAFV